MGYRYRRIAARVMLLVLLVPLLAGCGGGGGGSTHPCQNAATIILLGPLCAFAGPGNSSGPVNDPPSFSSSGMVTVPEHQIDTGYIAEAIDPEGDTVTYSIEDGLDGDAFIIDANTGELVFARAPDFENPGDADRDNVYLIEIRAFDSEADWANRRVYVTVTDVHSAADNNIPSFISAPTATVPENTSGIFYTAEATDPERDRISYSLDGRDRERFAIDRSFGTLRFTPAPDFENPSDENGDNIYAIVIEATDGTGLRTTLPVTVAVSDADDPPTFFSRSSWYVAENLVDTGYVARGYDPEGGGVTYGLAGGADQSAFNLDTNSGVLKFSTPPDFESPHDSNGDNTYVVVIEAVDESGLTAEKTVTVTVTDVPAGLNAYVWMGSVPTELDFHWTFDGVADAFRLEINPDGASGYSPADLDGDGDIDSADQVDGGKTTIRSKIPLHLTDFVNALYQVVALDADGTELERSNEMSLMKISALKKIGYFKASNSGEFDRFGGDVALSENGTTMVVGAPEEDGSRKGVTVGDPDDTTDSTRGSGAVYVFVQSPTGRWYQQAYIKASNAKTSDSFGTSVALSGDGDTLVVGAPEEDGGSSGVNGDEIDTCAFGWRTRNCARDSGAVYVFTRDETGAWSQHSYVKASNTGAEDRFGESVALSSDGGILAVGATFEDSALAGVVAGGPDATTTGDAAADAGAAYVFVRDGTGTWSQQAYLKASNTDRADGFGGSLALSDGGGSLVVGARGEDGAGTGVTAGSPDGSATGDAADRAGAAYVFERDGSGTWHQQAYLKASTTSAGDGFGGSVALSGDGGILAVGAAGEDSAATLVNGEEVDDCALATPANCAGQSGAVYVFERDALVAWRQQAYLKAFNTDEGDGFGHSTALSRDGSVLAVGAPSEDSNQHAIDGVETDNSSPAAGAVYVYTRDGVGVWSRRAYVKASNTDIGDRFGSSTTLSGNGAHLAVGASWEGSAATGVDGNQQDDSTNQAGAVYLY